MASGIPDAFSFGRALVVYREARRSSLRTTNRWSTRVGTIELAIPKARPGTYVPFVDAALPARRACAHGVVQEAYVHGVSTRKVDELMKALGLDGVSNT